MPRPGPRKPPIDRARRPAQDRVRRPSPDRLHVVHEDDDLLVVEKPAGLLSATVGDQTGPNLFDFVKRRVRDQARRRGTRVWIVHRLDKEVSGLVVFAKSERAYEALKDEFRSKRAHRLYLAVVEGAFPHDPGQAQPAAGTVQSFLYEEPGGMMRSTQAPTTLPKGVGEDDDSAPRLAVTHYRVVASGNARTLLQVRLETGRKNQIRVHMADLRHPIVGDRRYGANSDPLGRLCLHGAELGFAHPATGAPLRFYSPAPDAFYGLVGAQVPVQRADAPRPAPKASPSLASSWDHVAPWYEELIEERGSDHHERVILPGVLRLLAPAPGQRLLDVACGQGVLSQRLAASGVRTLGVDASPRLIAAATAAKIPGAEFLVGDARQLATIATGPFDAAACVMALMNIEPLSPVLDGVASLLRPGGAFVAVMLHPAFRSPRRTSWGWDDAPHTTGTAHGPRVKRPAAPSAPRQFRRVDAYLSSDQREITMNPGGVARGQPPVTTITYHRPIQNYVAAFAAAGLLVDALEEWPSARVSQPGPRATEENRARREIPLFLAIRARKV